MQVLLLHNHYQQPGGEDQVFTAESALLEGYGHRVLRYTVHNDRLASMNRLAIGAATVFNVPAYRELRAHIRREAPDVVHFHNTLPLISPAAYYAAGAEGVPVIQTLHNYRLLCANALFFREERVCEDCLGKPVPWPGVAHSCYRGSRVASGAVATMLTVHRALGTWARKVDTYIALTEFACKKFVQGGLPAEKIVVKPNFVDPDPGLGTGQGRYALFVGRLSVEKGLDTLLAAWERLGGRFSLKIVGEGPLAARVVDVASRVPGVELLGRKPREEVYRLMGAASFLVFPSECYENLPGVMVESFAKGTPVIASDLGSMSSLVSHGKTGLHFRPGDPEDLAAQVAWAFTHPAELDRMRREARREYDLKYTAERNYQMLTNIYRSAIERNKEKRV